MRRTSWSILFICKLMVCLSTFMVFGSSRVHSNENNASSTLYKQDTQSLFPQDQVLKINVNIEESEWEDMVENAIEEEYKIVTVVINEEVYPYVKIRPKGNSSLRTLVDRHHGSEQENDQKSSNRFSFKLQFNDINSTQTYGGITQLNLNNSFSDPSYIREYLGYQIYEEMGLPVPLSCFAELSINGKVHGLYYVVESILEPYLQRNFGDSTGDLFKSVGNTLAFTGSLQNDISGLDCKTTRKNPNEIALHTFIETLSTGDNLESVMDVDSALKYLAVTTAIANFDSYLGPFAHNYYLYNNKGTFIVLPWDLNMAFGGFHMGGGQNLFIDEPTQVSVSERPLVSILLSQEQYIEKYHSYLEEICTCYISQAYLENKIHAISTVISKYVERDPTSFYTYDEFINNITAVESIDSSDTTLDNTFLEESQDLQAQLQKQSPHQNVSPILVVADSMSQTILDQSAGITPSTNDGNGSSANNKGSRNAFPQQGGEPFKDSIQNRPPPLLDIMQAENQPRLNQNPGKMGEMHPPMGHPGPENQPQTISMLQVLYGLIIAAIFALLIVRYRNISHRKLG